MTAGMAVIVSTEQEVSGCCSFGPVAGFDEKIKEERLDLVQNEN